MGPVVSAKLGEYIRDVTLHRILRDGKLSGNFFVRISSRDQTEHIDLTRGQSLTRNIVQRR